jgi:alkylation response protein AidB-like acyl-CoA dehydrogenase
MPHVYGIAESEQPIVHQAARLAKEIAGVHAAEIDREARFPEEAVKALAEGGFLGLCVPSALSGKGLGLRAFAAVTEELATGCASTAMIFVMHTAAQQAIASSATLADRDLLLREMAAGQHLSTLALSEHGSRSHFWAPVSKLLERGDGFVVSAEKSWVTSAHRADSYVASAQKPGAASPLESTIYLARRNANGVGHDGHFDGLGLRGNDSAPVDLDEMKVAKRDLVSDLGVGATTMLEVILPWFSVGTAAMSNGLCRLAVHSTASHLSEARIEHLGQALRDLPTLRARLSQMNVRTEASRALLGRSLGEMEAGTQESPLFVLSTRRAALEAALEVTDLAMRTCGGAAFSRFLPLERTFRDARAGWVMAPTVDQLDDFIGKALTGLPLF